MPQFQPDIVTFNDIPGYGAWDIGHAREHMQFIQVLAQATPSISLPDFNLLSFLTAGQSRKSMLESHEQAHELLRDATGVQGLDLSQFNLDDEGDFSNFLAYHSTEHQQLRQALGII
jgi:hypothetical protein